MYKIMSGTDLIGIVANPTYVRVHDNGFFCLCSEADATGIAFDGDVHLLVDITLERTFEATVSLEYLAAQTESAELLALVGAAVENTYQNDLEIVESV